MEDSTHNASSKLNSTNGTVLTTQNPSQSSNESPPSNKNNNNNTRETWKPNYSPILLGCCGIGAGWTNIFITFPINKFSFRQQVESTSPQQAWLNLKSYFRQNHLPKNILYVYRGCSIPLVQKALANSIMYGSYSYTRNELGSRYQHLSPNMARALACLAAGSFESVLCTPLERCQAVLQDRRHDTKFRGLRDVLSWHRTKSDPKRLKSLYTGGGLIVLRNTVTTFNYFMIRDWYKKNGDGIKIAGVKLEDGYLKHAVFGMLSGAIGCTISYPINTIKNKIQTSLTPKSVGETIRVTYSKNSDSFHRGFYYGWRVSVFRSAISWGIQNSMYEKLITTFSPDTK